MTVGGEVVLRLLIALGLGHRLDVAGARIECHDRRGRVFGLVEDFGDRFARQALHVQVDRRVNLQSALFDGSGAVASDQQLADVFEEEPLLAFGVEVAAVRLQRRALGRLRLRLADVVQFRHLREHLVAPLPRGGGVEERVVLRGRLRQAGEQRRLLEIEMRDRLVEIDSRRGLHADHRLPTDGAVRDVVEVAVEDRLLAVVFVVFDCELELSDLLPDGALVAAQVQIAHELHRYRRGSLQRLAVREVLDRRTKDARHVDAVVFVEALVLDRHGRVLQRPRYFAPADRRAQFVRLDRAETRAVGGVDLRGAPADGRVTRSQPRCAGGDVRDERHGREHTHDQRRCERDRGDDHHARASTAAVPALSSLSGHLRGFELPCRV